MSKFSFSPGIVGYGLKGTDGSAGSTGLSMYFTNLNGIVDQVTLRTKILNNYILWSTSSPLPNGRAYQQGDLFVDNIGHVYYVNSSAVYKFSDTGTTFSIASYFEDTLEDTDNGVNRYVNTFSTYLIDNVYSTTVGEYWNHPIDIFSVEPKNFNRIEYTDVVNNTRNPFTIWIASDTCDNNAIALVRDTVGENTFRLGNLDSNGNARNVNIKFDVDKLMVSKDTGKVFTRTTDAGTVVTNYEIDANSLLTPVFNYSPTSFRYDSTPGDTSIRIYWDKGDFLTTTDIGTLNNIPASLFFFRKQSSYKSKAWNFEDVVGTPDASLQHMVFHNIDVSGYLDIYGLISTNTYGMYIQFHNQGWMRSSITKHVEPGITPFLFLQDPCLGYVTTAYTGIVNLTGSSYNTSTGFRIDISTNIASGVTVSTDKSWINLSTTTPSGITNQLVDVSISSTTSPTNETGVITYHSSAPDVSIIVVRQGKPTDVILSVELDSNSVTESGGTIDGEKVYTLNQLYMPTNTHINLDISIGDLTNVVLSGSATAEYVNFINIYDKSNILLASFSHEDLNVTTTSNPAKSENITLSNITGAVFPLTFKINPNTRIYSGTGGDSIAVALGFGDGQYGVLSPHAIAATHVSGDNITIYYGDNGGEIIVTSNV